MKLLVVPASLDLRQPFSATPAWWQLLKALHEEGTDLIACPWQGPPIESLWWRAAANPAQWQGDVWLAARNLWRRFAGYAATAAAGRDDAPPSRVARELWSSRLLRQFAHATIAPLWHAHLERILSEQPDIDALLFLTVPLNQLTGVPRELSKQFDVPVFYYDGDVPASLPQMGGFASGFRIYQGAQPEEYTAFICNSLGGAVELRKLGARAAYTVYYGVDETVFSPARVSTQDIDFFFYGHGREYRSLWIDEMIARPAAAMPDARFAVRGTNLGELGPTQQLPYLSFSKLREYVRRSRVNLCITRRTHASVYGSSSSRLSSWAAWAPASWPALTRVWSCGSSRSARSSWSILARRRWSAIAGCWRMIRSGSAWARQRARACWPNTPCVTARASCWASCGGIYRLANRNRS